MPEVVCLYEYTGLSARPWAEAGYDVYCYDILHETRTVEKVGLGRVIKCPWDATDEAQNDMIQMLHKGTTVLLLAFPPCDDLAVCGAGWFAGKKEADPLYRAKAMSLVYTARDIGEWMGCPYAIENPVSVISSEWRKPDHRFDPFEYGGYLPEGDVHPNWPEYYPPRDAYTKKTCYWVGGEFTMPERRPVVETSQEGGRSAYDRKLGGKSAKTKSIRASSPRGVARAIFEHMEGDKHA